MSTRGATTDGERSIHAGIWFPGRLLENLAAAGVQIEDRIGEARLRVVASGHLLAVAPLKGCVEGYNQIVIRRAHCQTLYPFGGSKLLRDRPKVFPSSSFAFSVEGEMRELILQVALRPVG